MFLSAFWNSLTSEINYVADSSKEKAIFQVLGIYAYLADKEVDRLIPNYTQVQSFVYEVLLTDKKECLKCILDTESSHLIQSYKLRLGDCVEVLRARCVKNKDSIMVLTSFTILPKSKDTVLSSDFPFVSNCSSQNKKHPLISSRYTYLNIWCTNLPYGEMWTQTDENLQVSRVRCDYKQELYRLRDTVAGLAGTHSFMPKPYPKLLVRILFKGALHHYGKTTKNNACPFQGYFMIGDHTGMCTMVVWDMANCSTFAALKPGDLITVSGYLTAKCYLTADRLSYLSSLEGLPPKKELQLKVNNSRQICRAYPEEVPSFHGNGVKLPHVKYKFTGLQSVRSAAADSYLDVVGLVLHTGNVTREKLKGRTEFCIYQWFNIQDHTDSPPVWIKFYNSEMNPIYPDTVVAFTRMKVIKELSLQEEMDTGAQENEFLFLTNIAESQVLRLIEDEQVRELCHADETMEGCVRWSRRARKTLSTHFTVGGMDLTPFHFPHDFKTYFACLPENEITEIREQGCEAWLTTLKSQWKDALKKLSYREHRPLLFYGQICRVEHVTVPSKESAQTRNEDPDIDTLWRQSLSKCPSEEHDQRIKNSVQWVLPHHYEDTAREELKNIIKFPCFSFEQLGKKQYRSYNYNQDQPDCRRSRCDFYILTLGNKGEDTQMTVHYSPEPAKKPKADSLLQMLRHEQRLDQAVNWQTFDTGHLQESVRNAHQVWKREFLFVIDLISLSSTCTVLSVRHIYEPPTNEDIQE